MQRHHLLPRQLLGRQCFGRMFGVIGRGSVWFDDFRANGLLLPATEKASLRTSLPLHRGPHHRYNEMVIERVGAIEADWATARLHSPEVAAEQAVFRLAVLQRALRRRLLADRNRIILNRNDPLGTGFDFTELDAMAESLWAAS